MVTFAHIDNYMGVLLGLDLAHAEPGKPYVVESGRRLTSEQGYGHIHGLWWIRLADGRHVVSVPPGAGPQVETLLAEEKREAGGFDEQLTHALREPTDRALRAAGLPTTNRVLRDVTFACTAELLRTHVVAECRRLMDDSVPAAKGLGLPAHCFPDGVVYGVMCDDEVTSCAHAHRTGIMEDLVCDVGVGTAPDHRRLGHARSSVSALVRFFTERGGEARYACSPGNHASIATARSVGFVPYGESLILSAPRTSG